MLQVGIVGLANVGKSTLFNALLKRQQAYVANYPFATIEPNVGIVPVPDERLAKLAQVIKSEEKMETAPPIVPATVKFVDIAGLVKGASTGAGLGNKFLAHIREVDLICHVTRAFNDESVIREGSTDPKSDMEIINTELILADLQTLESQKSKVKSQNLNSKLKSVLDKLGQGLNAGKLAKEVSLDDEEAILAKDLQLLTFKEMLYVFNANSVSDWSEINGLSGIVIDAKLEADLAALTPDEQKEYLVSLGIKDSGVNQLIKSCYEKLGLISFLTAGVKEVRAWTVRLGSTSLTAAGEIHTDFMKNFVKAEVVGFSDFAEFGGWKNCREQGKVRFEGRDYVIRDGDIVEFKVNI